MPGVNSLSPLLNCARPRIVPLARSMTLSTKSIRPGWEKSVSSSSFKRTSVPPRPATSPLPVASRWYRNSAPLVEGEFEPDRIDRDDCGEQAGIAAGAPRHQVALRDPAVADAAGDRRPELGVFGIQLGPAHHQL